ncbi:hypothetical protein GF327_06805 [Candidatus Woesearchaeota archaeon]|nr:hypothetical protein [Candidatus Woesearchaeota archaeon]
MKKLFISLIILLSFSSVFAERIQKAKIEIIIVNSPPVITGILKNIKIL